MTAPAVPLCDLQAQYRPLQSEIEKAVCRVLASGQAILGPEVVALEQEVATYCGVSHGVGCGSGTDALSLALHALGIGAGYMIAMWTAVAGVIFLPANGTQIAAVEADTTGTTTLGKRVVDHSFQLPLQVAWIVTALVGIAIVAVFH